MQLSAVLLYDREQATLFGVPVLPGMLQPRLTWRLEACMRNHLCG